MAFRDEHEAALQRMRSLEREVERARAARDRAEKKLLEVVIERDALAAEVTRQRRSLDAAGVAARESVQGRGSVGALGLIGIMVFAVIGLGLCRSRYAPTPTRAPAINMPPPPIHLARCSVTSDPPGAAIVSRRDHRQLGVTPMLIRYVDWVDGDGVEVSLDGHLPETLAPPADANHCDRRLELRPGSL